MVATIASQTTVPQAGIVSVVTSGSTAVTAVSGFVNGGYIYNPVTATDQAIAVPESLYVDPVGVPTLVGHGTTTALMPGQKYDIPPGANTTIQVNAATNGHAFNVVVW